MSRLCFRAARWIVETFKGPCITLSIAVIPAGIAQWVVSGLADALGVAVSVLVVSLAPAGLALLLTALGDIISRTGQL